MLPARAKNQMFNSISRKSLVSLLVPWYARVFVDRWYSVRAPKASSLMSKASVPLLGPILTVRLNKPEPGVQSVQVASVEKVPLPDGLPGLPVSVMLNVSALSGADANAHSATSGRSNRIRTSHHDRRSGIDEVFKKDPSVCKACISLSGPGCNGNPRS